MQSPFQHKVVTNPQRGRILRRGTSCDVIEDTPAPRAHRHQRPTVIVQKHSLLFLSLFHSLLIIVGKSETAAGGSGLDNRAEGYLFIQAT